MPTAHRHNWQLAVVEDMPYAQDVATSYKALKLLGGQLWPARVARSIFFDANLMFHAGAIETFLDLLKPGVSLVAFRHPKEGHNVLSELRAAKSHVAHKRMAFAASDILEAMTRQWQVRTLTRLRLVHIREASPEYVYKCT